MMTYWKDVVTEDTTDRFSEKSRKRSRLRRSAFLDLGQFKVFWAKSSPGGNTKLVTNAIRCDGLFRKQVDGDRQFCTLHFRLLPHDTYFWYPYMARRFNVPRIPEDTICDTVKWGLYCIYNADSVQLWWRPKYLVESGGRLIFGW